MIVDLNLLWCDGAAGVSRGVAAKEESREEVCYDAMSTSPQHTIHNLPPYTNVSVRLVLRNPEGEKFSQELLVLTQQDGEPLLRPYSTPHFPVLLLLYPKRQEQVRL